MGHRRTRRWRWTWFAIVVLGTVGYLAGLQWTGNIHTVVPGRLYRSATLSAPDLDALLVQDGIRTIINLRGRGAGQAWHDEERRTAEKRGVRLVDLPWSAGRQLTDAEVATFFRTVRSAKAPILIHCKSGADRTGLAVSLFLAKFEHASEEAAEAELSIRYGHFSIPFLSQAYAMDETWERLEPRLGFLGS